MPFTNANPSSLVCPRRREGGPCAVWSIEATLSAACHCLASFFPCLPPPFMHPVGPFSRRARSLARRGRSPVATTSDGFRNRIPIRSSFLPLELRVRVAGRGRGRRLCSFPVRLLPAWLLDSRGLKMARNLGHAKFVSSPARCFVALLLILSQLLSHAHQLIHARSTATSSHIRKWE